MRLRLEQLDIADLDLELSEHSRATIANVEGLRGGVSLDGDRIDASGVAAQRLLLSRLALVLGKVGIVAETGLVLESLSGAFTKAGGSIIGELLASQAGSQQLAVTIGAVAIGGRVELANVRVQLDGAAGQVSAERVTLSDVSIAIGQTAITIDRIAGTYVTIGWGAGFRCEIGGLEMPNATLRMAFPRKSAASADDTAPPAAKPARAAPIYLDDAIVRLLDGLSGQLDVDLELDLTVPVIGHRRATHPFRIAIANGTLDFMRLETDLSSLEDSLLDFAMRGNDLVLERGLPLLPTRGLGKPILRWDLEGIDSELAKQDRIRLAVLPRFQLAGGGDGGSGDGGGSSSGKPKVALRQLEARNVDAKLRLEVAEPAPQLPIRRIGEIVVSGHVAHDVDGPARPGELLAHLVRIELGRGAITAGPLAYGIEALQIERIAEARVAFEGAAPRTAQLAIVDLRASSLQIGPRSDSPAGPRSDSPA